MDLMQCPDLAVPAHVMQHVVRVESSFNPYAIGVVGGRLVRQPKNLSEAVATAKMLESRDINFSLGLAQVNRYNLVRYGLPSYAAAFQACPNLKAGSRILAECAGRSRGDWGKAFSCYYSGNFETGYRHGYVQKVFASMQGGAADAVGAIPLAATPRPRSGPMARGPSRSAPLLATGVWQQRIVDTAPARTVGLPPVRVATGMPPVTAGRNDAAPSAPSPAPIAQDGIAVIDPAGGPPRLQPSTTPPPLTTAPTPAVDTAFVF